MELLSKAVPITMLTFVVSSMLAVGLSLTFGQIIGPLHNGKLAFIAFLANFVLMSLGAYFRNARRGNTSLEQHRFRTANCPRFEAA
jgi:predicted Na+-dependent transporter